MSPYYPSIDQDLKRADEILAKSRAPADKWEGMDKEQRAWFAQHDGGGTIYGADTYAAYMLLKSFVEHIRYLHGQADVGQRHIARLERFQRRAIKLNSKAAAEIKRLRTVEEKLGNAATALGQQWKEVSAERDALRLERDAAEASALHIQTELDAAEAERDNANEGWAAQTQKNRLLEGGVNAFCRELRDIEAVLREALPESPLLGDTLARAIVTEIENLRSMNAMAEELIRQNVRYIQELLGEA